MERFKEGVRVVGFDDSPFKFSDNKTKVIGCVFKGSKKLEDVISTEITVDGMDSTERISKVLRESCHLKHIKAVFLDGITFGGFNAVDIDELSQELGKPVISVIRRKPSYEDMWKALEKVDRSEDRKKIVLKAGEVKKLDLGSWKIFFQHKGVSEEGAENIISSTVREGLTPEALRVAGIVASGINCQEELGR